MQLKQEELRLQQTEPCVAREACAILNQVAALPYCDIIDEADEALWHKRQLVYAWGKAVRLPDGERRWLIAQGLLQLLREPSIGDQVGSYVSLPLALAPDASACVRC